MQWWSLNNNPKGGPQRIRGPTNDAWTKLAMDYCMYIKKNLEPRGRGAAAPVVMLNHIIIMLASVTGIVDHA